MQKELTFGPRQLQILELLAEGMTSQEIADELGNAPSTVKTLVDKMLAKTNLPTRTALVAWAIREGVIAA